MDSGHGCPFTKGTNSANPAELAGRAGTLRGHKNSQSRLGTLKGLYVHYILMRRRAYYPSQISVLKFGRN